MRQRREPGNDPMRHAWVPTMRTGAEVNSTFQPPGLVSITRGRRLATGSGNKSCTQTGIQAGRRAHIGIDQSGVDVALGLHHHGVRRYRNSIGERIAFVRQRQATGWL